MWCNEKSHVEICHEQNREKLKGYYLRYRAGYKFDYCTHEFYENFIFRGAKFTSMKNLTVKYITLTNRVWGP